MVKIFVQTILLLLDKSVDGLLSSSDLAAELHNLSQHDVIWSNSKILSHAVHELYHFEMDQDIREKDPHYDLWQRNRLRDIASAIRAHYPDA